MGSWFSNIHIRKNGTVTVQAIADCVTAMMARKGYESVTCEDSADATVAMIHQADSQWVSLCSELLAHDDPVSCRALAEPISAQLCTDVLGIACFDSDYLYLNLVNSGDQLDAWVGIGRGADVGIERRTGVTAWKKKVADYPKFSAGARQKYVYAEEFLIKVDSCLGLPAEQSMVSLESAKESGLGDGTEFLYFRLREDIQKQTTSRLVLNGSEANLPCLVNRQSKLHVLSVGGESCGLTVYLLGPGVEEDTLTFSDVSLGRNGRCLPISVVKTQLPNGQWAYCYHDPDFPIPAAPSRRMKWEKRWPILFNQRITLQFVPRGDSGKTLDITVIVVPDQNPEGRMEWNVWKPFGSKGAFIDHHNRIWKRVMAFESDPNNCLPILKEEDFD